MIGYSWNFYDLWSLIEVVVLKMFNGIFREFMAWNLDPRYDAK
jgi:hypothetical protein